MIFPAVWGATLLCLEISKNPLKKIYFESI